MDFFTFSPLSAIAQRVQHAILGETEDYIL